MLRFLCLLIGILSWTACEEPASELPFSETETVKILADMYIMEAALTGKRNEEADSLRSHYQNILLSDYQIDTTELKELNEYLENHPEHSQELHDKARNRIDHLQRTVN